MSTESNNRYAEIDRELLILLGKSKSEVSFMHHFHRAQLLILRKLEDKALAKEVIDELDLFREGLIKELRDMRKDMH